MSWGNGLLIALFVALGAILGLVRNRRETSRLYRLPRSKSRAVALDQLVREEAKKQAHCAQAELIARPAQRRMCTTPGCSSVFFRHPAVVEGRCDACLVIAFAKDEERQLQEWDARGWPRQ